MSILHSLSQPVLPHGGDVAILGSTGSVGTTTLDVLDLITDRPFNIKTLICGHNIDLLIQQALKYKPKYVAAMDEAAYPRLKEALGDIKIYVGLQGILEACAHKADYIMSGIVGQAGLMPTLTAAREDSIIALANKECVVVGGEAFMREVDKIGARIFPVDSEHSALYHLKRNLQPIKKYYITASGGPFLKRSLEEMQSVSIEDTLKHPNWQMGAKISVDSATMVNKGLELIEAKMLFGLKNDQIDAVIHPQSVIHAMVSFYDGALQLYASQPDMRLSIGASLNYGALNHQEFVPQIDLSSPFEWDFKPIDQEKFPAFAIAKDVMMGHPLLSPVFNAANEIAVDAFLTQKITFMEISKMIEICVNFFKNEICDSQNQRYDLKDYLDIHKHAENKARELILQQKAA